MTRRTSWLDATRANETPAIEKASPSTTAIHVSGRRVPRPTTERIAVQVGLVTASARRPALKTGPFPASRF